MVTHSSVGALEHVELLLGDLVLLLRDNSLQGILSDVPQLVVLVLQEKDSTRGLAVEGGRGVQDGISNDLLDLLIRDWSLLLEGVVGAATLDSGEVFSRHCAG